MEGQDEIVFTAKYKDWIVVKKFRIEQDTKPEEVVAALTSVNNTVVRKTFDFLGINKEIILAYAQKACKGKRKGFASLSEVLGSLKGSEVKAELLKACPDEKLLPFAENYLLRAILDTLGMDAEIDLETLGKIYPHVKVSKPRGNFKKKA
ncbi:MAG: DUF2666 family protein [Candidatus Micrarchaeia archaeon]